MGFEIRLKDGEFYYLNDDGEYVKVGSGSVVSDADWVTFSEDKNEVVEEGNLRFPHIPAEELSFTGEFTVCSEPQPVADVDAVVVEEEELA